MEGDLVLFAAGDAQAETWVLQQGLAVLRGKSSQVAGAIRRKAITNHLTPDQRKAADRCADVSSTSAPF